MHNNTNKNGERDRPGRCPRRLGLPRRSFSEGRAEDLCCVRHSGNSNSTIALGWLARRQPVGLVRSRSLTARLPRHGAGNHGFTCKELIATIAATVVLLLVLVAASDRERAKNNRICCLENLHQIGLSFKTWPPAQSPDYPMAVPASLGGSRGAVPTGEVFRHFQVMSNELNLDPKRLVCPADIRSPARDFQSLANSNLSYFVGVDANESYPQMFLAGDRNLTNGVLSTNRLLVFDPNRPIGWTAAMHNRFGNILIVDGSAQFLSTAALQSAAASAGSPNPERLAIP